MTTKVCANPKCSKPAAPRHRLCEGCLSRLQTRGDIHAEPRSTHNPVTVDKITETKRLYRNLTPKMEICRQIEISPKTLRHILEGHYDEWAAEQPPTT